MGLVIITPITLFFCRRFSLCCFLLLTDHDMDTNSLSSVTFRVLSCLTKYIYSRTIICASLECFILKLPFTSVGNTVRFTSLIFLIFSTKIYLSQVQTICVCSETKCRVTMTDNGLVEQATTVNNKNSNNAANQRVLVCK